MLREERPTGKQFNLEENGRIMLKYYTMHLIVPTQIRFHQEIMSI